MEWFGTCSTCGVDVEDPHLYSSSDTEASDSMSEGDGVDSDACKRRNCKEFREEELKGRVHLERGLKFRDIALFKEVLKLYAIWRHFDYKFIKNDKLRCTAICKSGCG